MKPVIGRVRPKIQANPVATPVVAPAPALAPTGLPKPKVAPQKVEDPALAEARVAVENYELQRRMLNEMREDWEKNYPEAYLARQDILRQEDLVTDAIAKAKPLIAAIKQTIGEFKATRKFKKAHYDEKEVTQILSSLENRLEVFEEMISSGIVDAIGLNREATIAWFAQRPGYAEAFHPAFKEEQEDTCAVTTPKL